MSSRARRCRGKSQGEMAAKLTEGADAVSSALAEMPPPPFAFGERSPSPAEAREELWAQNGAWIALGHSTAFRHPGRRAGVPLLQMMRVKSVTPGQARGHG